MINPKDYKGTWRRAWDKSHKMQLLVWRRFRARGKSINHVSNGTSVPDISDYPVRSPAVTKRLSVGNEGHRPSQLSRNTCRAFAASGDKVSFSHRIFAMRREKWFHLFRISGFSGLQRSQRARHCYVILITMSKQTCDQFCSVKTCRMQCYRGKRHGHTRLTAIRIMV